MKKYSHLSLDEQFVNDLEAGVQNVISLPFVNDFVSGKGKCNFTVEIKGIPDFRWDENLSTILYRENKNVISSLPR